MERSGSTAWNGGLPEGKGSVSTKSRAGNLKSRTPIQKRCLEQLTPPVSRRARTPCINAIGTS